MSRGHRPVFWPLVCCGAGYSLAVEFDNGVPWWVPVLGVFMMWVGWKWFRAG